MRLGTLITFPYELARFPVALVDNALSSALPAGSPPRVVLHKTLKAADRLVGRSASPTAERDVATTAPTPRDEVADALAEAEARAASPVYENEAVETPEKHQAKAAAADPGQDTEERVDGVTLLETAEQQQKREEAAAALRTKRAAQRRAKKAAAAEASDGTQGTQGD